MKFIKIALTLSAHGIKIAPGVEATTMVLDWIFTTYSTKESKPWSKCKLVLSEPSDEDVAPNKIATSDYSNKVWLKLEL